MTVNKFKAKLIILGFSHDISAFTYTNENYITIYIYISKFTGIMRNKEVCLCV